jgi:hypothetical protein
MKLIEDCSNGRFGKGTNPDGGGFITIAPETEAEQAMWYFQGDRVYPERRIDCRLVKHSPNPQDGGVNPKFVEVVRRYGFVTKGYPELVGQTGFPVMRYFRYDDGRQVVLTREPGNPEPFRLAYANPAGIAVRNEHFVSETEAIAAFEAEKADPTF